MFPLYVALHFYMFECRNTNDNPVINKMKERNVEDILKYIADKNYNVETNDQDVVHKLLNKIKFDSERKYAYLNNMRTDVRYVHNLNDPV